MSSVFLMPNRSMLIDGPSQNRFGRNLAVARDGDFVQPRRWLETGVGRNHPLRTVLTSNRWIDTHVPWESQTERSDSLPWCVDGIGSHWSERGDAPLDLPSLRSTSYHEGDFKKLHDLFGRA
ncbi:hypothetical protein CKO51_00215 [Rhodopirellula sp. SM50]|nr:hypothetical protein CKO51_00215 [Rhodopirellula sp. SM50]